MQGALDSPTFIPKNQIWKCDCKLIINHWDILY